MAAKGPLREFGNDPVSGKPVTAKDGKFGAYVTDGETNASLSKGRLPTTHSNSMTASDQRSDR